MTTAEQGADLSGNFEDPKPPAIAYRKVPKAGVLNRFLKRTDLVVLPQYFPAAHSNENFDFAYLMSTGAITPDQRAPRPQVEQTDAPHPAVVADQAAAMALRNLAEQSTEQAPPQN